MENVTLFKNFTRGGQITMHAIRMLCQASKYVIKLTLILAVISFFGIFYGLTTEKERVITKEVISNNIKIMLNDSHKRVIVSFRNEQGKIVKFTVDQFLKHPATKHIIGSVKSKAYKALGLNIIAFLVLMVLVARIFVGKSKKIVNLDHVRGSKTVCAKELAKIVRGKKLDSDLMLAKVPLVKESEKQHVLISGTIGTGKTVAITELLDQARAKKQKAIIYDCDGTYISSYYRPGIDIILNPLDERTAIWNIWQDCDDQADFEAFAESLIPLSASAGDPFWVHSARTILSTAGHSMRDDNPTTKKLLTAMLSADDYQIKDLIKNTVAETLVSEKIEKTALSIKATLSTYCKSLMYLPEEKGDLFSIRKWIMGDNYAEDSCLFIATNKQKAPAMRSLLTSWLDLAVRSILSMSRSFDRRVWFFVDELPSLHQVPSLKDVLAEGRKFGCCFVAGVQDLHQVRTTYGRERAETILSLFNTKVAFRSNSAESAAWLERAFGTREIVETKEGFSYGANEIRDGVSLNKERRREPVILASEITNLNNLEAYLKLPGDLPVGKVKFKVLIREEVQPGLVAVDLPGINLLKLDSNISNGKSKPEEKTPIKKKKKIKEEHKEIA